MPQPPQPSLPVARAFRPRTCLATAFLAIALLGGCREPPAGPNESEPLDGYHQRPCAQLPPVGRGFVTRAGSRLRLEGKPFRALGANVYFLQQLFAYGEQGDRRSAAIALEALDQAVCLQVPVVRTLAFNDTQDGSSIRTAPGVYRETGLRGLDRAVAEARRRGLRLILTLSNNWTDYGGLPALAAWTGTERDAFFREPRVRQLWKDYASLIAGRINTYTGVAYRDEPAIVAWEIANELRCRSCRGTDLLVETVRELAGHLKAVFPRHLVGDGGEGFDDVPTMYPGLSNRYPVSGEEGASFSKLLQIPDLDLLSYHYYPHAWKLDSTRDADTWIDTHERLARLGDKVGYLGEFADRPEAPEIRDAARAPVYDAWLDRLMGDNEGQLALIWQLVPAARLPARDDGHAVSYEEHLATVRVIRSWTRALR